MASTKEAIAIVIDVGPSMNQAPAGDTTFLETALTAANKILQRKLFSESKDEVCLVLFGTDNTANNLADDGSYQNITVARELGMVDWDLLSYVEDEVQPGNDSADFLDAIVVAMDTLVRGTTGKRGFVSKRLILFTDVGGEFGDDQLDDIIGGMKEAGIEFNVIGPDLDEDEEPDGARPSTSNGHMKEKTAQQRAGEAMLKHIIEQVEGASYSFSEALPALSYFQSRQTRPTAWKCQLEVSTGLKIPIAAYIRVKEAKAKTFKTVYAKDSSEDIMSARTYHLNDEEETEIDQTETVEGHRYGNTLVPFSSDDKDAMKYRAEKCFKVLGFTKSENVKLQNCLGDNAMTVVSEKGDEAAAVALSAFIKALYETNMVAVVRRVYSGASGVKLGCLIPHIKATYECLFYTEIPFAEDVRQFTFSSLPLTEECTSANKKLKPTDDQLTAMDDLITTMDLTNTNEDDDDEEAEEAVKPKLTFNPYLQRLYQCLQCRALNPKDPLPELSPQVAHYLQPPQVVLERSESATDKLRKLFKLEMVAKKKEEQTGEKLFKDNDADDAGPAAKKVKVENDGLDGGMADVGKVKVTEVGTVTPVEDFKAMVGQKDADRFEEACQMMQKRILQLVTDSFRDQFYEKARDCLKALRDESIKSSEPNQFNDYLSELKDSLPTKGRTDFWDQIVKKNMTLISKMECEDSRVTKDEAKAFLQRVEVEEEKPSDDTSQDADDLLAEME